jgi:dTMP kinase
MFITLEGIEGSGKTTQLRHIAAFLESKGRRCVITREPGGTRIGEKIRSILLDPKSIGISPHAELLLYVADRVQHVRELIEPALASGSTVLCDRFSDATLVYQGAARGLDPDLIRRLHALVLGPLTPHLTLLLDLPPEIGLARAWKEIDTGTRDGRETRFEQEALAFHGKVREGYLLLARSEPERFRVIDARQSEEKVREAVFFILSGFIQSGDQ